MKKQTLKHKMHKRKTHKRKNIYRRKNKRTMRGGWGGSSINSNQTKKPIINGSNTMSYFN